MDMHSNGERKEESGRAAVSVDIRHLSEGQLAALGVSEIAYVKLVLINGAAAIAIHAADGSPIGIAADEKVAMAAIRQNGMEPALVH
ncbi:MAG: DUF1150 family protein [Acetobacteraceae bacterium]